MTVSQFKATAAHKATTHIQATLMQMNHAPKVLARVVPPVGSAARGLSGRDGDGGVAMADFVARVGGPEVRRVVTAMH